MCQVAGFDLSGNESVTIRIFSLQSRAFAACAPITIHAGEAMSAKSIWEAVYKLGAQRIGHGLRLRDDKRLLEHCVRNDICMELCPISNSFTNPYRIGEHRFVGMSVDQSGGRGGHVREQYPMRDFLDAGLEVCINTDNRSIHIGSTLTDEYIRAAQLSGGLTKWEILRIVKSGFKNAFLAKRELAALLRHVEYELYRLLSEHSGEKAFAEVERFRPSGSSITADRSE